MSDDDANLVTECVESVELICGYTAVCAGLLKFERWKDALAQLDLAQQELAVLRKGVADRAHFSQHQTEDHMTNDQRMQLMGSIACIELELADLKRNLCDCEWSQCAESFEKLILDLDKTRSEFRAAPKSEDEKYTGTI
jgi:hypothetical protein